MTRCGTERIGTSVQTVRLPVRKVGPGRAPLQGVGQERPDVGQPDAALAARCDVGCGVGERGPGLHELPAVARCCGGQGVQRGQQRCHPVLDGVLTGQVPQHGAEPVDQGHDTRSATAPSTPRGRVRPLRRVLGWDVRFPRRPAAGG